VTTQQRVTSDLISDKTHALALRLPDTFPTEQRVQREVALSPVDSWLAKNTMNLTTERMTFESVLRQDYEARRSLTQITVRKERQ